MTATLFYWRDNGAGRGIERFVRDDLAEARAATLQGRGHVVRVYTHKG